MYSCLSLILIYLRPLANWQQWVKKGLKEPFMLECKLVTSSGQVTTKTFFLFFMKKSISNTFSKAQRKQERVQLRNGSNLQKYQDACGIKHLTFIIYKVSSFSCLTLHQCFSTFFGSRHTEISFIRNTIKCQKSIIWRHFMAP